ncbi:GNAT family protein [Paenibacillus sp. PK4536]|uniref:GNAT family N-acetyltransferase n=1 Tax=Paenibacillus sp. PK4536 TaxID=3024576 RepID=UPI00235A1BFA|nr:GNAT family protein [Paenibacillus sp. PK4536]WIM40256.1 GNAT family protein [Paenibacillus sp. PK4536]
MSDLFAFEQFPQLETSRFVLRQAQPEDSHDLYELYADEAVVEYMPFTPFTSVDEALDEMKWYTRIFAEQSGLRWMIEDREHAKVIGTCGFLGYEQEHHRAELGYDLSSAYWGKGIMKEVALCIIQFGFEQIELNKIEAKIEPKNQASIRLMEKLEFVQEGLLRQHEYENGKYVDLAVFALLQSEYVAKTKS